MAEFVDYEDADAYVDSSQITINSLTTLSSDICGTEATAKKETAGCTQVPLEIANSSQSEANLVKQATSVEVGKCLDQKFVKKLLQLRAELEKETSESKETNSLESLDALNQKCEEYSQMYRKHLKRECSEIVVPAEDEYRDTLSSLDLGRQNDGIRKEFHSHNTRSPFATPSPKRKWHGFTDADDEEIVGALIIKNLQSRISDKTIWEGLYDSLSEKMREVHTASSVQNRFRKKIFPNLSNFVGNFEELDISKFPNRYQGMDSPHRKQRKLNF